MRNRLFLLLCMWVMPQYMMADELTWFDGSRPITYALSEDAEPVVKTALGMFCDDMRQVTGMCPVPSDCPIIRITHGHEQDDGFRLFVQDNSILIHGHNGRGAAYGLLELSRLAGVSPWLWWGDIVPQRRQRLVIDSHYDYHHRPSVAYRGIFLNDEDWSIRPWSYLCFEPGEDGQMGRETYRKIFEFLLRLRANTIWPAMHEGTKAFFQLPGIIELADSFGVIVGTSHCEPLLRNNVGEWNKKEWGPFNYKTNRETVQDYWIERLRQITDPTHYIYTIGMRGIHDSSMEGYTTDEERLEGLQQVIDDQQRLLARYAGAPDRLTQMFVPYKEVLHLYEMGLRVPDYVTLLWCDDNYGYMTRYSDAVEQQRSGGAGLYYHLSYWGRPHDYLWLTTTQPGLIFNELREAYQRQVRKIWIANVHDVKVAGYDLELFLDLSWDIHSVTASTLSDHYRRWLCRQFGEEVGRQLFPAMHTFFRLCGERRPEFMGWTQVELDKKRYPQGLSPVGTVGMTVDEADSRQVAFEQIRETVAACRYLVRPSLSDAYFAAIEYPVYAAAAMNRKILSDAADSHRAYQEIQRLTAHYNRMNEGKWCGLMNAAPRNLPVFGDVRGRLLNDSIYVIIQRDASEYQEVTDGAETIQMLGHSMASLSLPQDGKVTYYFSVSEEGDYQLLISLIPTHAVDQGDVAFNVSIDGDKALRYSLKEPFRSERWKENVLCGQTVRKIPLHLQQGIHRLDLSSLTPHVVIDRWSLLKKNP